MEPQPGGAGGEREPSRVLPHPRRRGIQDLELLPFGELPPRQVRELREQAQSVH